MMQQPSTPRVEQRSELQFIVDTCQKLSLTENLMRNMFIVLANSVAKLQLTVQTAGIALANVQIKQNQPKKYQVAQQKIQQQIPQIQPPQNEQSVPKNDLFLQLKQKVKQLKQKSKNAPSIVGQIPKIAEQLRLVPKPDPSCCFIRQYFPQVLHPIAWTEWADPNCYHYKSVDILDSAPYNTVRANRKIAILFSKIKLQPIKTMSFSIVSHASGSICFGIIDSAYGSTEYVSQQCDKIFYRTDGYCYDGKNGLEDQGRMFQRGQIITMVIDRQDGRIQWKCGKQCRNSCYNQKIKDINSKIIWVPYIILSYPGDCVSFIQ